MDRSTWISPDDSDINRAEATRMRNRAREPHILDPKVRRIGLDIDAINQQIAEKKQRETLEKEREAAFDGMLLDQQDRLLINQEEYDRKVREMNIKRNEFRKTFQRPEQSREYDIWRKDYLKVQEPIRDGDEDPRLGISSGQIFQGEDLHMNERLAQQAEQRREWYNAQKRELEMKKNREKAEDLRSQLNELETQKLVTQMMENEEFARRAVRTQLAEDNLALLQQKRQRTQEEKDFEQRINDAEIRHALNDPTITERMVRRGGDPQDYRGMTIDEQRAIIAEQKKQMEDNERRRKEEAERERQWEEYQEFLRTEGDRNELEYLKRKKIAEMELAKTQFQQEQEFKERQRFLNRKVYGENIPDDYYYNQWGNSIR